KEGLVLAVVDQTFVDYTERQSEQWERPLGDLRFFTKGLQVLFDWLGENQDVLRLATWVRLEGYPLESNAHPIIEAVRAQIDHLRTSGALRQGIDTDMLMILIDAAFKGYWDRREQLTLYGLQPSTELDVAYRKLTIEALVRGLFQGPALDDALALIED
ncbi:MAG: hypothetical protein AAFU79_10265, partial [Myxococcota bacterium]